MIHDRKKKQFDQSQYEIFIICSEKGDLAPWNEWRENNIFHTLPIKFLIQN